MSARSDRTPTWSSIPFFLMHVIAVAGLFVIGFSWKGLLLAIALYYLRMFAVTGGYHRYFAHRTYRTSRVFHTILAALAQSSCQKGVLWWASHHRTHHKYSDQPKDVHSAKLDGFWWSHVGWIVSKKWENTDETKIRDLAKYPELRFMDRFWYLSPIAYSIVLYALGGWFALFWGFFFSTVLLWHGTFFINSLTHMFGRRRFETTDNSKNSFILALVCTTITSARRTRDFSGGRSISPSTSYACSRRSASSGTCTSGSPRRKWLTYSRRDTWSRNTFRS